MGLKLMNLHNETAEGMAEELKAHGLNAFVMDMDNKIDTNEHYDPFRAIIETVDTIEKKEDALRKLLENMGGYSSEFAKQQLSDMSFLDDFPEWKERATEILKEFVNRKK